MVEEIKDGNEEIEGLLDRIVGRYSQEDVLDPKTGEVIVKKGDLIDDEYAQQIVDSGVKQVYLRSVLTCRSKHGVCVKCYGRDLATGFIANVGEAVGIVAAQSIGEPGTQLTMRTFHTGGLLETI